MKQGLFMLKHNETQSFAVPRNHNRLFLGSLHIADTPINECTVVLKSKTGSLDAKIEYKRIAKRFNQALLYNDNSPHHKIFDVMPGLLCDVTLLLNDIDAKLYQDKQFGLHWR